MSTQETIYCIKDLPVIQNRVYSTPEEAIACPKGDVVLVKDSITGIIHNAAFRPELMGYDENYQNEQGCSAVFQKHLLDVAAIIGRHFVGKSILEVGCGKGKFLELIREKGFSAIGIDPAYEGDAPNVIRKLFSPDLGVKGDGIILRHVLEHIPNPVTFLESLAIANGRQGLIYIEIPCFDWIRENCAWFDIFYEHVNYFRLSDFSRIFRNIIEWGKLFGGQYLYIVADLGTLGMNDEEGSGDFHLPSNFLDGINQAKAIMRERNGKKVIWGGASKGVIFALHLARRDVANLSFVIDINPAKQGKYLPATGLPVLDPETGLARLNPGDTIFVMNSNYLDEIRLQAGEQFIYHTIDRN